MKVDNHRRSRYNSLREFIIVGKKGTYFMNILNFILLGISLSCVVFGSCINNKVAKSLLTNYSDNLFYNLLLHGVGTVVMLLYARRFAIHSTTLLLAALFGFDSVLCCVISVLAFKNGPLGLTTLVTSAGSLLFSTILGTVLFHETAAPIQVAGIALILAAMCILTNTRSEGNINRTWFFLVIAEAFCGGMQGIIQKWQGSTPYAEEKPAFLLYTFIFCTVFVGIWLFVRTRTIKSEPVNVTLKSFLLPAALITGCTTAVVNIINLRLAIEVPAVVFFPINSGGYIILTSIASSLYFKEKLTRQQKLSFVICFAAVFLVANVF